MPRTATARGVARRSVLALERETFLEAVTALPDGYEAAAGVAERHLSRRT